MSTNTPHGKKRTDTRRSAALPTVSYLGKDTEGFHHAIDRNSDVVMRYDGLWIERITPLQGRPLDDYKMFVESEIGWETRQTMLTTYLTRSFKGGGGR